MKFSNLSLEQKRKLIRITTIIGIILTIVAIIFISHSTYFKPGQGFEQLLRQMGWFAPILFVLVQISQIVYPIIPMGLTNVIGVLIFGLVGGVALNTIGILLGSAVNFYLGYHFGGTIVRAFIDDAHYNKYIGMINEGKAFERVLMIGFIAPIFPDDIFCMIAGMSDMPFKKFMIYVALFRPISMFVYTYVTTNVLQVITDFLF